MRLVKAGLKAVVLTLFTLAFSLRLTAQTPAPEPQPAPPAAQAAPAPEPAVAPAPEPAPAPRIYTVPAGTKVLLQLRSAVDTRSAKPGDGVYLVSEFPVVVGNRVMIPAGVYVQGMVDRVERAGHVKGKAQLDMHFTTIIYPNGTVVEIPGVVNSLPGATKQQVEPGGEGTIEQDSNKTRNMGEVAKIAIPSGSTVGALGGMASGHPLAGGLAGMGAGLAAAGIASLFTRGADVNIPSGTQVEMILQRPLILEESNLAAAGAPGAPPALVPSSQQPKPMQLPGRRRITCPPGGLGCD
jgi:type IV secretion system protein VirB10